MLTNYCICSSKLNCHSTSFMCSRHREVGKRGELLKMSIWWCSFTFSFVFVNLQQQQQLSIADNDIQGWSFVCLRCLSKSAHYRQQQIYAPCLEVCPVIRCVYHGSKTTCQSIGTWSRGRNNTIIITTLSGRKCSSFNVQYFGITSKVIKAFSKYSIELISVNGIKLAPFWHGFKDLASLGNFCCIFQNWQLKPM